MWHEGGQYGPDCFSSDDVSTEVSHDSVILEIRSVHNLENPESIIGLWDLFLSIILSIIII